MLDPRKHAALSEYAARIKAFNDTFKPQPIQLGPLKALFTQDCKRILMRFGRQTGKSVTLAAMAVRWCLLNPESNVFIIGPTSLQIRQIFLHSGLIERMIPPEYNQGVHKTDARFQIADSSIRLYGADNREALRGLTASLVLCDELKDLSQDLIESILKPALLVRGAPLVLSGTPPGVAKHFYWDYVDEAEKSPEWKAFRATSYENTYTPVGAVEAERQVHEARGTLDVFKREFLGEFCPDSHNSVFPMFSRTRHVRAYTELKREVLKDIRHWRFYVTMDPGSRFAVLIVAINEYTKKVLVLDEVFERGQESTSIGRIFPRVLERINQIAPAHLADDPPIYVADEAALWARNEILTQFGINVWPSRKAQNQKADGLSLMKDLFLKDKLILSDRCIGFMEQLEGYVLGPNGLPVKREDDLPDCFRYALGVANYALVEEPEPAPPAELPPGLRDDPKRAFRMEDEFADPFDPEFDEEGLSLGWVE
jgi:hypothetical protein